MSVRRQWEVGAGERVRHGRREGDRCRRGDVVSRRAGGDVLDATHLSFTVGVGELHHEARRRALCHDKLQRQLERHFSRPS